MVRDTGLAAEILPLETPGLWPRSLRGKTPGLAPRSASLGPLGWSSHQQEGTSVDERAMVFLEILPRVRAQLVVFLDRTRQLGCEQVDQKMHLVALNAT